MTKEKLIDAVYVVGTFLVFGGWGVLLAWRG
jgi:hypothetical protein